MEESLLMKSYLTVWNISWESSTKEKINMMVRTVRIRKVKVMTMKRNRLQRERNPSQKERTPSQLQLQHPTLLKNLSVKINDRYG